MTMPRRPGLRPTLRDVAERAGVSVKTVSRVVNGEGGVSAGLVERVQQAAGQLEFQLNFGARSLRRADGRTATIGVVLENIANPFSSALHREIENVARGHGVAVLAGSLDEDPRRERELVAAFIARRVDGLVMMPTGSDHEYLRAQRRAGTALVFVDRAGGLPDVDVVLAAHREGAASGVLHLIAGGHRRIGFLGDLARIPTAEQRFAGYRDALSAASVPLVPRHVVRDLTTPELAEEATLRMLTGRGAPTALFTAQNLVTIGALRAVRRLGRQHEVAVVGFDDVLLADLLDPAVTVVAQDATTIGRLAAECLFRRMDGDPSPYAEHVVPTRLVVRGSGEIPPPRPARRARRPAGGSAGDERVGG